MRRAGYQAHLYLDTCNGKAWVGLRVMLGPVQQDVRRRSPSYFRRQERRRAANATDGVDVTEKVSDNAEEQKDDKSEKI